MIESAAHLVPFVKEAFLHFTDRSVLSRLILFLSFLSILISSLPQSSSLVLADLRPAAADGSLSVTPAVWLQSRRLGRPCCCVGVDGSLVVGSGGYKALGYFRVSLFFFLCFFFLNHCHADAGLILADPSALTTMTVSSIAPAILSKTATLKLL